MSTANRTTEELANLKALVSEALSRSGAMNKIKADIRANVFDIIKQTQPQQQQQSQNLKLQRLKGSREGRLLLDMVTEFLEFFEMPKTLSVFTAECAIPDKFDLTLRPVIGREINLPLTAGLSVEGQSLPCEDPVLLMLLRGYESSIRQTQLRMASHEAITKSRASTGSFGNLMATTPMSTGNLSGSKEDLSSSRGELNKPKPRKVVLDEVVDVPQKHTTNIDLLPPSSSSMENLAKARSSTEYLTKAGSDLKQDNGLGMFYDEETNDDDETENSAVHTEDASLDDEDFKAGGGDADFEFETEDVELVDFEV